MMRTLMLLLLTLLWAAWLYFFIEVADFAYAFTHNIPDAVLPGSPIGLDFRETIDWAEAVAILYGTPVLLGILTWWALCRGRKPIFRKKRNASD